jgi:hypothetical protein
MGWCSATDIFDNVAGALLDNKKKLDTRSVLMKLIEALESGDWDCQQDSAYWDNPVVQGIMRELHPRWFEDETQ